jgi:hypothetical protein
MAGAFLSLAAAVVVLLLRLLVVAELLPARLKQAQAVQAQADS